MGFKARWHEKEEKTLTKERSQVQFGGSRNPRTERGKDDAADRKNNSRSIKEEERL